MINLQSVGITIVLAVISYFIGNISPATIMGKVYGVDIRKEGSGNPGTTNVLRTLGKKAAACTLVIDVLKGVVPVLIGKYLGGEFTAYVCGTCAFLGHIWPVRYRFRGGKGIATGFGVTLALDWRVGITCLIFAVLGALITKRMSCGSIAAAVALPVSLCFFQGTDYAAWAICLAAIVIWRHRSNIRRIINGEEPPMSILVKKSK